MGRLAYQAASTHNRGMSLVRSMATAIFVLAFIVGAQVHVVPMMMLAKADVGMAGMMHGSPDSDCKGCGPGGTSMKASCSATCAAAPTIAPPTASPQVAVHTIAWLWTNDSADARSTAPELAPPRS